MSVATPVVTQALQEATSLNVRAQLIKQDQALQKEEAAWKKNVQSSAVTAKVQDIGEARENIAAATRALQGDTPTSLSELKKTAETIRAVTRPVYGLCSGAPWADDKMMAWNSWRDYISDVASPLVTVARSVGVIFQYYQPSANAKPEYMSVGATAFVVGKSHILTNRHVLKKYAYIDSQGKWRLYDKQLLLVSFPLEYSSCAARTPPRDVRIVAIEAVGEDGENNDYAILRTEDNALPPAAPMAPKFNLTEGSRVAVIGYPARPVSCSGAEAGEDCTYLSEKQIDTMFKLPDSQVPFPAERIAPGMLLVNPSLDPQQFSYDASTWGGNSGSPIVRLSDGMIVGLHYGGVGGDTEKATYNNAIKIDRILKALADAGVTQ
ncbi:trypsin-like serine peptidase [Pandoraea anhela]|uniref:trypsin-like serine peptidase n=1 Tax=Pandoraea anhela TaxID=2508295 RepID=UPI001581F394|nr:serine protease [Pandoraea anhela]